MADGSSDPYPLATRPTAPGANICSLARSWRLKCVEVALRNAAPNSMLLQGKPIPMSTHCSGVATAAWAAEVIQATTDMSIRQVSACDCAASAQKALRLIPSGCEHIHSNVLDLLPQSAKDELAKLDEDSENIYDEVRAIVAGASLNKYSTCVVGSHWLSKKGCVHTPVAYDFSTTPCRRFSPSASTSGTRRGKHSVDVAVLLTVIKLHSDNDTPVWSHENVVHPDMLALLRENCEHKWHIFEQVLNPKDSGYSRTSRTRIAHTMVHKIKAVVHGSIQDVYSQMKAELASSDGGEMLDWWDNDPNSMRAELLASGNTKERGFKAASCPLADWSSVLTPHEAKVCSDAFYPSKWTGKFHTDSAADPNAVWSLMQNPHKVGGTMTLIDGSMPTLTRRGGKREGVHGRNAW